jgi:hypothetical protein
MSALKKTRVSGAVFGLGKALTDNDATMTGARLPTCEQVLRCLMWNVQNEIPNTYEKSKIKWKCAKIVLTQLKVFYLKGNIPMLSDDRCCSKILELYEANKKLRDIPISRRESPNTQSKLEAMKETLAKTFQLWPKDAKLQDNNDIMFLQSMESDRVATFGCENKQLEDKLCRKERRQAAEARRSEQSAANAEHQFTTGSLGDEFLPLDNAGDNSPGQATESKEDIVEVVPSSSKRSHHRTSRPGTSVFIEHDIMKKPSIVSAATRMNITPSQQSVFIEALIKESGGDVEQVATSYASVDRARRTVVEEVSQNIKAEWTAPKAATLHWDGKQTASLTDTNVKEERLPILVGNSDAVKLLGVAKYPPGSDQKSGKIIAGHVMKLLDEWKCKESIASMCFDTTASNTGHLTAACVTIQQSVGRALLWCACRHHIGETVVGHVFEKLKIEVSKSPEVTVFQRFKKNWSNIPYSKEENASFTRFNASQYNSDAQAMLMSLREEVLQTIRSNIPVRREDYKEFAELCQAFLNDDNQSDLSLRRPGAMHKARWMAKMIYSIKICLLETHIACLPRGTVTTLHQMIQLNEFVVFIVHVYSAWWLKCEQRRNAPWNDLMFYKTMLRYRIVNSTISEAAIKAFDRHLWYLTPELVVVALFSDVVPSDVLRDLADALCAVKPKQGVLQEPMHRFGTGYGKPKFHEEITETTKLSDLVNEDSWYTIKLLQLNMDFLPEDIVSWKENDNFKSAKQIVKHLNFVNDSAERGVKLSTDYVSAAKGEEHFQVKKNLICNRLGQHYCASKPLSEALSIQPRSCVGGWVGAYVGA